MLVRKYRYEVVEAYTDGSVGPKNPGECSTGWVILRDGSYFKQGGSYLGHGTVSVAELTAILEVLMEVPKEKDLIINTDSQYCINVITLGHNIRINECIIHEIKMQIKCRSKRFGTNVTFNKVKSHSGDKYNDLADTIAVTTRRHCKFVEVYTS